MDRTGRGLLLRNGNILTRVDTPPVAALLALDGLVVCAGDEQGAREVAASRMEAGADLIEVDLKGGWALPGFQDGHGHLGLLARSHGTVNLRSCRDGAALVERVVQRARRTPAGEWVRGHGWDETRWDPETAKAVHHGPLSAALPTHPVLLTRVDEHAALLNRQAMVRCGIDPDAPGQDPRAFVAGGRLEVDDAGRPTGLVVDRAMERVAGQLPPEDELAIAQNLLLAQEALFALGLTGVHDMAVGERDLRRLRRLARDGAFRLGVSAWLWGEEAGQREYLEDIAAQPHGPLQRDRREPVLVCGVKLFGDGALGSRGAALLAPYTDDPEESGLLLLDPEEMSRLAGQAVLAGFTPAIHAIGDRANRQALDTFEHIRRDMPRPVDPADSMETVLRIEHAQVVDPVDMPRFSALGVTAAVQPGFALSDGPWLGDRLGPERLSGACAWSRLGSDPARLCLGTDFPIEEASPLRTLYAARTCSAPGARVLTAVEALEAHTLGVARAAGQGSWRGRLDPGYEADVTVLDGSPLGPARDLPSIRVTHTIRAGQVVYQRADVPGSR